MVIKMTGKMKKIKLLVMVVGLLGFSFCGKPKDLDKSFNGGVVIGKCQNGIPNYYLTVKKSDSTFVTIQVYPSYFEYYQMGDTIN